MDYTFHVPWTNPCLLEHRQTFELKTCSNRNKGSTQATGKDVIEHYGEWHTVHLHQEFRLQLGSRLLCILLECTVLDLSC